MAFRQLSSAIESISGKKVIVRANFDVPIENQVVEDTTRIEDAYATIDLLLAHACQVILLSHYDRPDGNPSPDKSLKAVIPLLQTRFSRPVAFVDYQPDFHQLKIDPSAAISLVENLRFWPDEENNNPEFSKALATFGEIYVNEAFANCHRDHASMVGIPQFLPAYAGISLSKELSVLEQVTLTPKRPLVVVIGGAKLETKEPLVAAFAKTADTILVGGKIAADMQSQSLPANTVLAQLTPDTKDITPASAAQFAQIIRAAGTVIWNGTLGKFEEPEAKAGTKVVAEAINQTPAFTLIGGGDTEAALTELNLESGIDYISTGGGAMLTYLSTGTLTALAPLKEA